MGPSIQPTPSPTNDRTSTAPQKMIRPPHPPPFPYVMASLYLYSKIIFFHNNNPPKSSSTPVKLEPLSFITEQTFTE
jgi:hypothetical protein